MSQVGLSDPPQLGQAGPPQDGEADPPQVGQADPPARRTRPACQRLRRAPNRTYRELARHYGFQIDPAPPKAPKKKGKVERNVRYVRYVRYVRTSFLSTLESVDIDVDRRELRRWLVHVAGRRRHGTTGRMPIELFEEQERAALLPLPAARFETVLWKEAKVHRDTHVQVEGAFYSVPWRYITRQVCVLPLLERLMDEPTTLRASFRPSLRVEAGADCFSSFGGVAYLREFAASRVATGSDIAAITPGVPSP